MAHDYFTGQESRWRGERTPFGPHRDRAGPSFPYPAPARAAVRSLVVDGDRARQLSSRANDRDPRNCPKLGKVISIPWFPLDGLMADSPPRLPRHRTAWPLHCATAKQCSIDLPILSKSSKIVGCLNVLPGPGRIRRPRQTAQKQSALRSIHVYAGHQGGGMHGPNPNLPYASS
jgi:hypothetical protein